MRRFLILLMLSLFALPAQASDWKYSVYKDELTGEVQSAHINTTSKGEIKSWLDRGRMGLMVICNKADGSSAILIDFQGNGSFEESYDDSYTYVETPIRVMFDSDPPREITGYRAPRGNPSIFLLRPKPYLIGQMIEKNKLLMEVNMFNVYMGQILEFSLDGFTEALKRCEAIK